MSSTIKDQILGTIKISDEFDINSGTSSANYAPIFSESGDEHIVNIVDLDDVVSLDTFEYTSVGEIENRYLKTYYRISKDNSSWSNWFELSNEIDFPKINPNNKLYVDIKWVRECSSDIGDIRLTSYEINGTIVRNGSDLTDDSFVCLGPNEQKIIGVPYIYKVFRIKDIEVLGSNPELLNIQWRYSQDNGRTWSNYEPFTKENVTTKRINPIKFFQVEYLVKNESNNKVNIQDINIIGEVQNVTNDYNKTNLIGIRECCKSDLLGTYVVNV